MTQRPKMLAPACHSYKRRSCQNFDCWAGFLAESGSHVEWRGFVRTFVSGLLVALLLLPALASAGDGVAFDVTSGYFSHYIFRGADFLDENAAWQSDFVLTAGETGIWVDLWFSRAVEERDVWKAADELDIIFGYDTAIQPGLNAHFAALAYTIPNDPAFSTAELALGFSYETMLNPRIDFYYDYVLANNGYLEVSLSHELAPMKNLSTELGVVGGYDNGQYVADAQLSNVDFSAVFNYGIDRFTLIPEVHYVLIPDHDKGPNDEDITWFGVSLAATF